MLNFSFGSCNFASGTLFKTRLFFPFFYSLQEGWHDRSPDKEEIGDKEITPWQGQALVEVVNFYFWVVLGFSLLYIMYIIFFLKIASSGDREMSATEPREVCPSLRGRSASFSSRNRHFKSIHGASKVFHSQPACLFYQGPKVREPNHPI